MPGPSLEEGPARQADRSWFRQSIRGAVAILAIHADGILFFHAAKRHGEETLETAGLHETSATNRSPVDTYEGHRPDPFEWQREHALAQTVVSVTCFAPFAMLPCTGRGANVPKKVASTRRLSAISGGTTMIWHRFAGFAPKRKRTSFLRLSCVGDDFPFRFCS